METVRSASGHAASPEPIPFTLPEPDAVVAKRFRDAMAVLLEPVCSLIDDARAAGMNLAFSCAPDQYGRSRPTISIVKPLA